MWDGANRRKSDEFGERLARIEERIIAIDKRINGSIDSIEKHIEHSGKWRLAIASVAMSLVLATISAVYAYGKLCGIVADNTQEIMLLRK